jgi:hypothetical protein
MTYTFCDFHRMGWTPYGIGGVDTAAISCKCCRDEGFFTQEQIQEFEKEHFQHVARYKRPLGYPSELVVVLQDTDTEEYAKSICPKGSWELASLTRSDPFFYYHRNEQRVERPIEGMTLENSRKSWDFAPEYCY